MGASLIKFVEDGQVQRFVDRDEFNKFLNQEPPTAFVKEHPIARGVKYIPIDKVELMLTKIFQQWYPEVLREGQLLNSVYAAVRVHYYHPIEAEWRFTDGLGAAPVKTDKGASAADMAAIKNDAIVTGLPAAKSFAIKDAAEHLGRLFGRDLNRKDTIGFTPSYGTEDVKNEQEAKKQALREKLHANTTTQQKNRPRSVDGGPQVEGDGQNSQDDQAAQ